MDERTTAVTCEVIWHPELFLELSHGFAVPIERAEERDESTADSSIRRFVRHLLTHRPKQPEQFSIPFEDQEEVAAIDDCSVAEGQQLLLAVSLSTSCCALPESIFASRIDRTRATIPRKSCAIFSKRTIASNKSDVD